MGTQVDPRGRISVQVFAYAPTIFTHCQHCEIAFQQVGIGERIQRRESATALPQDLLLEYQKVSDWVHALLERHPADVEIRVVDPVSVEGSLRALRHGIRRFPAVVIGGRDKVFGPDLDRADRLIEERVAARREGGGRLAKEG